MSIDDGRVAGHLFLLDDRCACGIRWLHIHHLDLSYVGQKGYAHVGEINATEIDEIQAENTRRRKSSEEATKQASH